MKATSPLSFRFTFDISIWAQLFNVTNSWNIQNCFKWFFFFDFFLFNGGWCLEWMLKFFEFIDFISLCPTIVLLKFCFIPRMQFWIYKFPYNIYNINSNFNLILLIFQIDEASQIKNTDIAKELSLPPVKLHCSSKFFISSNFLKMLW